jgi:hypothetical protein
MNEHMSEWMKLQESINREMVELAKRIEVLEDHTHAIIDSEEVYGLTEPRPNTPTNPPQETPTGLNTLSRGNTYDIDGTEIQPQPEQPDKLDVMDENYDLRDIVAVQAAEIAKLKAQVERYIKQLKAGVKDFRYILAALNSER